MLLATDNRIDAERVKDNDGGSVDNVDNDSVDTDEGGGVGDGDPKSLPCAALPRIDEVSWLDFSQCRGPVTPRVTSYGPESAYKSTNSSTTTKSSTNCRLL